MRLRVRRPKAPSAEMTICGRVTGYEDCCDGDFTRHSAHASTASRTNAQAWSQAEDRNHERGAIGSPRCSCTQGPLRRAFSCLLVPGYRPPPDRRAWLDLAGHPRARGRQEPSPDAGAVHPGASARSRAAGRRIARMGAPNGGPLLMGVLRAARNAAPAPTQPLHGMPESKNYWRHVPLTL